MPSLSVLNILRTIKERGAVSCYSGTFVPVAPQKGTPAAD